MPSTAPRPHSTSALELDGVIVTKLDGDARGGAVLSVKHVTGVPDEVYRYVGERFDALEPFRPEGMASRILGQGDMLGLRSISYGPNRTGSGRATGGPPRRGCGRASLRWMIFVNQLRQTRSSPALMQKLYVPACRACGDIMRQMMDGGGWRKSDMKRHDCDHYRFHDARKNEPKPQGHRSESASNGSPLGAGVEQSAVKSTSWSNSSTAVANPS